MGALAVPNVIPKAYLAPTWASLRVEKEDAEMGILLVPWASRGRKALAVWMARFGTAIARCNAGMISCSQHKCG